MRLAALDVGSNSIHLLVADAEGGGFRVVARDKEVVRLAEGAGAGHLQPAARARATGAIRRLLRRARALGAQRVEAVATSAVREADDGGSFCAALRRAFGVDVRILSGAEEAVLVYRAARAGLRLQSEPALVADIGGGSLEIAVGDGRDPAQVVSEPLGVIRLNERFRGAAATLDARGVAALAEHVRAVLGPHLCRLGDRAPTVVGTSGTILALGRLAMSARGGDVHGASVPAGALAAVRRQLVSSTPRQLGALGLGTRSDTIVAGAILLDELLKALGATRLQLCAWALREGLLLAMSEAIRSQSAASASARRDSSVKELAVRYDAHHPHASHVAALAVSLFDQTARIHRLGTRKRGLLRDAALLHGVGGHVTANRQHRHGEYVVRHGGLSGFHDGELEVLALLVRYHRRRPRRHHDEYAALPALERRAVRVLTGLLRLADALDRSARAVVRSVRALREGRRLRVLCAVSGAAAPELRAARATRRALERALDLEIRLRAEMDPAHAGMGASPDTVAS